MERTWRSQNAYQEILVMIGDGKLTPEEVGEIFVLLDLLERYCIRPAAETVHGQAMAAGLMGSQLNDIADQKERQA